jgi:tetratricopeptide (TPR) repeat protein
VFPLRILIIPLAAAILLGVSPGTAIAQQGSSSSSSSENPSAAAPENTPVPRVVQPEAAGSAITLETSESLFYLASALNACGEDTGLAESNRVRLQVRDELNQEFAASEEARNARDPLCAFIREHALSDRDRSIAQYISLSLYLNPPPQLTLSADETELPPDSAQVVGILPLLRNFGEAVHLNALWAEHHTDYQAFIDRVHDPMTNMVLNTNLFLHLPTSSYDGRRFMVELEPMLPPAETNARIYGSDYVIVVSPSTAASIPMELIRHTYLHYLIEPMVYSRAKTMDNFVPLLKTVQDAPLEFTYKSDIVALMTECLIKAVEAELMDVGLQRPQKPASFPDRSVEDRYLAAVAAFDRKAEAVRRNAVDTDMRQGWILVGYFYNALDQMQKSGDSLKDQMGPMLFGMSVDAERRRAEQIVFLTGNSGGDPAFRVGQRRPQQQQLAGVDLGEMKLMKGDVNGAGELAESALKTNPDDARAHYLLGRIELMQGHPDEALQELTETVRLSKDPRTTAWAHIYLGRMYDIAQIPQRDKALAEYRAALASRDSQPDTKAAAEKGIKAPFALPRREVSQPNDDSAPLDPTGKAEKDSYRPGKN